MFELLQSWIPAKLPTCQEVQTDDFSSYRSVPKRLSSECGG